MGEALGTGGVEEGFERYHVALGVGQWDAPVRVFVVGARLVLRTLLPHRVGDRGGEQLARRTLQCVVQRVDDIRLVILTMFGKVGIKITLLEASNSSAGPVSKPRRSRILTCSYSR